MCPQCNAVTRNNKTISLAIVNKAIVNICSSVTVHSLKLKLVTFNNSNETKFKQLFDNQGRLLWQDLSQSSHAARLLGGCDGQVCSIGVSLPGIPKKQMAEALATFAAAAQSELQTRGFKFEAGGITVSSKTTRKGRSPTSSFAFAAPDLARGFYYLFYEYVWQSDSGPSCVVRLHNEHLEAERSKDETQRVLAAVPQVTPFMVNSIVQGGSSELLSLASIPTPARGAAPAN